MNDKPVNNRAWFFVLPVLVIVLFSALLPLMTVVNYSVQDTIGQNAFFWNGAAWFRELLDPTSDLGGRFARALQRNLAFSFIILLIEVALLCFAGLKAIPDAYYQAARIDGASRFSIFRNIELPKLRRVLVIAILLRFMDSFMIYTEPFVVTGGGPGNSTTFISVDLVKIALGEFDLGRAAALSLVYNIIILSLC